MATRTPDQKGVVDAIIDEQIDVKALAQEAYDAGVTESSRVMAMARKVHAMVTGPQRLDPQRAKDLLREGLVAITLIEYAKLAGKVQALSDQHTASQKAEFKKYGKPLATVGMVRNVEIKARENEKAGVVNKQGVLDGDR